MNEKVWALVTVILCLAVIATATYGCNLTYQLQKTCIERGGYWVQNGYGGQCIPQGQKTILVPPVETTPRP